MLNINDHSRDSAKMKYIYPVISRRAGGISVGINLNVNNACNWACIYCQVPNLTRGGPLAVELKQLENELRRFLIDATTGDFLIKNAPPEAQRLVDIAFSGNGEPTSAPEFAKAIKCAGDVLQEFNLPGLKLRLITNGSFIHRPLVRQGIAQIGKLGGEVWFKLDRASKAGVERINGIRLAPEKIRESLLLCAELAPTWIQTCYFAINGCEADATEQATYLEFIGALDKKIKGVHLYGLARPSMQPEADKLSNLPSKNFLHFAQSISALGIEVVANP